MALTPLTEVLGKQRAAHLLRRTVFGASPDLVDEFAAYTPQQALEQLFVENLEEPLPPIDPATGQEWMSQGTTDQNSEEFELQSYFLSWQLGQFMGGKASTNKLAYIFRERLVFFLHTHFTTKRSVVGSSRALYFQNQLFRSFAFDGFLENNLNFKSLVVKVCVDNAMLRFLDGFLNVKGNPNENFARELLELYSVGRGLEGVDKNSQSADDYGTFTEQDVQQGARILSGFNVDRSFSFIDEDTGLPTGVVKGNQLNANQHDNDPKTLSFRFNNAVIAPKEEFLNNGQPTYESVLDEIQQLVDVIFEQEETAKHICRKIYRFFFYHEITEEIHDGIIADLAQVFVDSNYSLQAVLEALFTSREFYEGATGVEDDIFGSIIKSPLDLMIGHSRSLNFSLPDYIDDTEGFYEITSSWLRDMSNMGLNFYEPFEVAGYSPYHQFPIYQRGWITTTYLTQRYAFIKESTSMMEEMNASYLKPIEYVQQYVNNNDAANARRLVEIICSNFLCLSDGVSFTDPGGSPLTEERLNYFLNAFLKTFQIDDDPEAAWNFRWTQGVDPETVTRQLEDLFNAVLQSPEYQLM